MRVEEEEDTVAPVTTVSKVRFSSYIYVSHPHVFFTLFFEEKQGKVDVPHPLSLHINHISIDG